MNGRRAIIGLCMLCALLVSAFAAHSASAISGTTALTCVKGGEPKNLRGEHCLTTGTAAQEYGHVIIFQDTTTEVTGTNAKTKNNTTEASVFSLKVTIAGVPLQLQATGVSVFGWMENKREEDGEHNIWSAVNLTFTGVTVKEPAGRGCKVYTDNEASKTEGEQGVVHSGLLQADTYGRGDALYVGGFAGGNFARFFLTCEAGKQIPAIEGTWECIGGVKGVPNGATVDFTHAAATEQNSLKCKGSKAGIDGSLTLEASEKGSFAFKPLAATTVTT